ncbi:hypothetical protein BHM03_00006047, partial [Ensete ventricosum]
MIKELQELHSALEEAKADIVGLWALKFFIDQVSYRYADRPLPGSTTKIDRRRSISAIGGRLREKSIVGDQFWPSAKTFPRAVLARAPSPPASRSRAVLTRGGFFSHARRRNVSPRREKDRGDVASSSPTHRRRPRVTYTLSSPMGDFSPALGDGTSSCVCNIVVFMDFLQFCQELLPKSFLKSMYVSFLAGCFRSIRFGLEEAHGYDSFLFKDVSIDLFCDKPAAMSLLQRYAKMTQPLHIALEKLERVQ